MNNKKILIVDGPGYGLAVAGLGTIVEDTQDFLENPEEYKLVLFSGGADVSPELYGHTSPKGYCGNNPRRDSREVKIFQCALANDIPMVGICRGSQFLNVMSGGVMIHHLDNHGTSHDMRTVAGDVIRVTSTHHQMSIPSEEGHVIAWSEEKRSGRYFGDKDELFDYKGPEVEAIYYPKNKIFAAQYHPEYMPEDSAGYRWFLAGAFDLLTLTEQEFTKKYVLGEELEFSA